MPRPDSRQKHAQTKATVQQTVHWSERRFFVILIAICLTAALVRVVILSEYVRGNPLAQVPLNDAAVYWEWAGRIADGQLIENTPFFSAPLYPYLLGALRAVGGTLTVVYVAQMLMDVATACLLASVCRRRFSGAVGLLAAALFLLLQEPASAELRILASSLHLLLVTVLWAVLTRVEARGSVVNHVLVGIALGLLCLAYAPALLLLWLVPAWLLWCLRGRWQQVWRPALSLGVGLAVIAPATLHNWWVSGDVFMVQAVSGITLRLGNHEAAQGVYSELPGVSIQRGRMHADAARVYREATGKEPTWKAVDRYFRSEALRYWRENPRRFVELAAIKTWGFVASRVYGDIYQPVEEIKLGLARWLRLAPIPTPWLMGPALVGLVLLLRQPRRHGPEWLLLLVPLVVVAAYWYSPRFRMPAIPMLVIMSAVAIERASHWRNTPWLTGLVGVVLIASMCTGLVNRALGIDQASGLTQFNMGSVLMRLNQPERAERMWRDGLRLSPKDATRRLNLADMLATQGRRREAIAEYEQVLRDRPQDVDTLRYVVAALCGHKWLSEARPALERLRELDPDDLQTRALLAASQQAGEDYAGALAEYEALLERVPDEPSYAFAYGELLIRMGRWADARAVFERIVATQPGQFESHMHLGGIAVRQGDFDTAVEQFELALAIEPDNATTLFNLGAVEVKRGRLEAAAGRFGEVLAVDPNNARARDALRQVEAALRGPGEPNP